MTTLIALVLAAAFAVQEKTYDLTIEYKPVPGEKRERANKEFHKMILKVNGQTAARVEQAQDFLATEEILSVEASGSTKRKWTFSRATHRVEGRQVQFVFHGKSVVVTDSKGKDPVFAFEGGGELAKEDVQALRSFGSTQEKGKPSAEELFAPGKPVKAGETWTKDVKKFIETIDEKEAAYSIDPAGSKISFTLKSVASRGGADYGQISGALDLMIVGAGPMKLERPVPMKFSAEIDSCIDGKSPDGEMKMRGEMWGKSPVNTEKGQIEVEIDYTMVKTTSLKLSK